MLDTATRGVKLAIVIGTLSILVAIGCYQCSAWLPSGQEVPRPNTPEMEWRENNIKKQSGEDYFGEARNMLLEEMESDNIENYLRYLTTKGHMAGTKQDLEQAEYIRRTWLQQGLDKAYLQPYEVQLSYPDVDRPNKVYLIDESGTVKFTSSVLEEPWDGTPYDDTIPRAFMAFAPKGSITTNELVFVNYGRFEDYERVESMGISVAGRVVIAKFGRIFRGDVVLNAQRFNATGVIFYTDPSDYHPDTDNGGESYPNSFWLPGSGIQRGSIMWRDGDPTTPLYPSISGSYRLPENAQRDVPRIPAHTISYNDARKLLVNMGGPVVPEEWQGRLNLTYRMGPQLAREGWSLRLEVNNIRKMVPTYNVIGVIRGSEEPDRYVILGNHRDSWAFGSCDPSSGTATLLELTRSFGQMMKKGWQPRRSIILASFGAGEYGFFGATEWVEENLKIFQSRAVAYLNVDLAVIFSYNLRITATPMMQKIIIEAMKVTPAPEPSLGFESVWDHWTKRVRRESPGLVSWRLGSTSEHAPFYQRVGIPVSNMLWAQNYAEYGWIDYPLYHTTFEDFEVMKNFIDPSFKYHLALGHLWGVLAIGLADGKILPMDPTDETQMLEKMVDDIIYDYGLFLERNDLSISSLKTSMHEFSKAAELFNMRLKSTADISPLQARQINDQLLMLEKCFIDEQGNPLRTHMKNVVFGTSIFNQYIGWDAPALREALWNAMACKDNCSDLINAVRQQIATLQFAINSAVLVLQEF